MPTALETVDIVFLTIMAGAVVFSLVAGLVAWSALLLSSDISREEEYQEWRVKAEAWRSGDATPDDRDSV